MRSQLASDVDTEIELRGGGLRRAAAARRAKAAAG